ncbi:MAG: toll/interleukin-1 receptor domain-containing protein, partial [Xanthobacteraceae bacterium]
MPFVPGAKNDVFISYAHFDNEGGATGERWVSDFVQRLEGALKQRLGCPVDIYFDTRSLEGHQVLTEILDNVRRSAVFVPILSPSYVNRKWTKDELEAFVTAEIANRIIFTIERLPLETEGEYPESLRERKRSQFWFRTEDSGVVDILTPGLKPERYFGAITDVVDHMARQLRTLKSA